jgi:hypothetical protein
MLALKEPTAATIVITTDSGKSGTRTSCGVTIADTAPPQDCAWTCIGSINIIDASTRKIGILDIFVKNRQLSDSFIILSRFI